MKTCLITLDIINDICHTEGKLARFSERLIENNTISNINRLIEHHRQRGDLIMHVRVAFRPQYQDGSDVSPIFSPAKANHVLQMNEWGSKFCEELNRNEHDVEIIKHRVSAFYGTDLELILRANKIEHLVLCGVATNNAVELTAREAHDRDFKVSVIGDACETVSSQEQEASLNFLKRISQVSNVVEHIA